MEEVEGEVSAMKRRKGNGTCQCTGCNGCCKDGGVEKCEAVVGTHRATVLCSSCKRHQIVLSDDSVRSTNNLKENVLINHP